jgi:hypothetical protein
VCCFVSGFGLGRKVAGSRLVGNLARLYTGRRPLLLTWEAVGCAIQGRSGRKGKQISYLCIEFTMLDQEPTPDGELSRVGPLLLLPAGWEGHSPGREEGPAKIRDSCGQLDGGSFQLLGQWYERRVTPLSGQIHCPMSHQDDEGEEKKKFHLPSTG